MELSVFPINEPCASGALGSQRPWREYHIAAVSRHASSEYPQILRNEAHNAMRGLCSADVSSAGGENGEPRAPDICRTGLASSRCLEQPRPVQVTGAASLWAERTAFAMAVVLILVIALASI